MEIAQRTVGTAVVMAVTGRLDAVTAPDFEAQMRAAVAGGAARLVVDASGLSYVSSAGLRALLVTAKLTQGAGGGVAFAGVQGTVRSVFDMSGFATMFTLAESVDDAVGALG